ncbi:phenylacetate--CoA ligase family protein [Siminovitchia acidinfaciens]|uniref:Phenylacetate--CoA ligase family protein n=1 Tax=Siminovitchia acidinfaciens TaxID=2321395 RepID=A0A429XZD9_9BACI|nr:phenylacetate--CoA ligase family protein [Siminovitchia acidinfaciens]RST74181.1 phenylacetate--CoA ligase family protein [Siminovitchia acidinfaciens]
MIKLYDPFVMNVGEITRNRLFFIADKLLKKNIYSQIKDVEKATVDPDIEHQMKRIIRHAVHHVPYYSAFKDAENLSDLPVIDKQIIRENMGFFIPNNVTKDELIKVTTSGSSGTPMSFYRTSEKKVRQIAEVIYLGRSVGYYFGMKHGFIRATHPKGRLNLLLQNEIHIDPTNLSETNLEEIRQKVKSLKMIIGFPSTLYEIALFCLKKGDKPSDFKLKGIICTAEPLLDKQRSFIEKAFGCPIQVRYATEELGLVAVQHPDDAGYRINEASFFVEILKLDDDTPCAEGEEGRIVVTDFYSFGMPLIRYDTGDLGTMQTRLKGKKKTPYLSSISGRKIELIYSPSCEKISPFSINVKMKDVEGVKKFQFIQKGKNDYVMNVIPDSSFFNEEQVMNILRDILGEDADIRLIPVEDIPTLASGKTPYIVNEYIKT